MYRLDLANLLSVIFDSKITGKGKTGNGKIYARLFGVIADRESDDISAELSVLRKFGGIHEDSDSWHRLDKFLSRFLKTGSGYPYDAFTMEKFEECFSDVKKYNVFVWKMQRHLDAVIAEEKTDALIYSIIRMMSENVTEIFYGGRFVPKSDFFGRAMHIKRICLPALVIGALYHVHKNHKNKEKTDEIIPGLMELPLKRTFVSVQYRDERSFVMEEQPNIPELLALNAMDICKAEAWQSLPEKIFEQDVMCEGEVIDDLSGDENIFVCGTGGIGKTAFLIREAERMKDCVCLYFPLYRYSPAGIEDLDWTAVQVLLKYIFLYEYSSSEMCFAAEGRENVLKIFSEILMELRSESVRKKYLLILDGYNEMRPEYQDEFSDEIRMICSEWKNTRVIVSGRNVPPGSVFKNMKKAEICPLSRNKIMEMLDGYNIEANERLLEILGIPLFLDVFIKTGNDGTNIASCGELIDRYISSFGDDRAENSLMRFTVRYILPFAAKKMNDDFGFEISRAELSKEAEKAFETYIYDENVYQNFISVQNFRKNHLLKSRERFDIVEYITENICLMRSSPGQPHLLHFTHQFFRDYFAARQIVNIFRAADVSFGYGFNDEKEEMYSAHDLELLWCRKDNDDFFRMLGEMVGDYRNRYCENFVYTRTLLDDMLDFARNFKSVHSAENIMLTMKAVRGSILCGADFSGMSLPIYFPDNVSFSADGKYPCIFRNSWVFNIRNYESAVRSFINCDFSESVFFDDECRDFLAENGAIVTEAF